LFYKIVKILVRLALQLYCNRFTIANKSWLRQKGPLLLACNHPNSFFDAIIIGSQFNEPVHFLARGDAFKKPWVRKLLSALKMIPIYRLREGREYLALNDATFDTCGTILANGGILLIFSEGLCINDYHIRPLKKGTARIAINAWSNPTIANHFKVLPVGISYNNFRGLGKKIFLQFGEPLLGSQFNFNGNAGESINRFNEVLSNNLQGVSMDTFGDVSGPQLLLSNFERIAVGERQGIMALRQHLPTLEAIPVLFIKTPPFVATKQRLFFTIMLMVVLLPAASVGWLLHAPLYYLLKNTIAKKTTGTVFFDSVLFGVLLLLYPLLYVVVNVVIWLIWLNIWVTALLLLIPLWAKAALLCREAVVAVANYLALSKQQKRIIDRLFT